VFNGHACLFIYLAEQAFFCCFFHVNESANDVESALCRLLGATGNKQFVGLTAAIACPYYECYGSRTGIGIINKTALPAALTLYVVLLELRATADRAEMKFF
jgi:hypothetical protein